MFFLSIDCPFCCKVQIILCFESRLHIHYIVHGFRSIIHWLLFTLFSHISFHRKKFNYPLYQLWWMFSGLYDMGRMGVRWTTVHIVSVDATLSGSGVKWKRKQKSQTHTCIQIAYWSSCFPYVWVFYRSFLAKSWHGSSNKPQSSESWYSHSANVWVFDVEQQNIAKGFTFALRFL